MAYLVQEVLQRANFRGADGAEAHDCIQDVQVTMELVTWRCLGLLGVAWGGWGSLSHGVTQGLLGWLGLLGFTWVHMGSLSHEVTAGGMCSRSFLLKVRTKALTRLREGSSAASRGAVAPATIFLPPPVQQPGAEEVTRPSDGVDAMSGCESMAVMGGASSTRGRRAWSKLITTGRPPWC